MLNELLQLKWTNGSMFLCSTKNICILLHYVTFKYYQIWRTCVTFKIHLDDHTIRYAVVCHCISGSREHDEVLSHYAKYYRHLCLTSCTSLRVTVDQTKETDVRILSLFTVTIISETSGLSVCIRICFCLSSVQCCGDAIVIIRLSCFYPVLWVN